MTRRKSPEVETEILVEETEFAEELAMEEVFEEKEVAEPEPEPVLAPLPVVVEEIPVASATNVSNRRNVPRFSYMRG